MDFVADTVLPAPSHGRIEHVEAWYRLRLPQKYKELIQFGNGGVPKRRFVPVGSNVREIERLLAILDDPRSYGDIGWYDIGSVFAQIEDRLVADENLLGTDLLPFVALVGGDFACLDYRASSERPAVCIWSHEESDEGLPVTRPLAENFDEFLSMLTE